MGSGASSLKADVPLSSPDRRELNSVEVSKMHPSSRVIPIGTLADSLRCYQNTKNGEIMLLIGSTISSISSITDQDRWNEVYLAPQAIEYLNNSQDSLTAYNTTIMKRQLDAGIPPGSSEAYATPLNTKDVGKGSPLSEFDSRYTSGLWDDGMHVGAKDEGTRYTGGSSGSRPSVDSRYFHGVSAEKAATAAENNPNNSVSSSASPKLDQMDKTSKGNIGISGISLKSSYTAFAADDNDHYEDDDDVADVNDEITSHTPHYVHASNIEYDNHNTSGGTAATNIYTTFDFIIVDNNATVHTTDGNTSHSIASPTDAKLIDTSYPSYSTAQGTTRKDKENTGRMMISDIDVDSDTIERTAVVKAVCHICSEVIVLENILQNEKGLLQSHVEQELQTHSIGCIGLKHKFDSMSSKQGVDDSITRFMTTKPSLSNQLQEFHKINETSMRRELMRAMRTFEYKCSVNNRALHLLRSVMMIQPGMIDFGFKNQKYSNPKISTSLSSKNILRLPHRLKELCKESDEMIRELDTELQTVELETFELKSLYEKMSKRQPSPHHDTPNLDDIEQEIQVHVAGSARLLKYMSLVKDVKALAFTKIKEITKFLELKTNSSQILFIKQLTRGSYAKIYLAYHKLEKKHVAIKVLDKDLQDDIVLGQQCKQANLEKKILLATNRGFIDGFVSLHSTIESSKNFFFLMEYCIGGDCLSLIRTMKVIPEITVSEIMLEVCYAVKWMHENGVIHRDIKPDNCFITASGHVKLGDFGISTNRLHKKNQNGVVDNKSFSQQSSYTVSGRYYPQTESPSAPGVPIRASSREGSADHKAGHKLANPVMRTDSRFSSVSEGSSDFDSHIFHDSDHEEFTYPSGPFAAIQALSGKLPSSSLNSAQVSSSDKGRSRSDSSKAIDGTPTTSYHGAQSNSGDGGNRDYSLRGHTDTSDSSSYYYKRGNSSVLHFTPVGNVHYMSPECIKGSGYDHMVDWWAVGIMTFQLLCGVTPFENRSSAASEETKRARILKADILWDNTTIPTEELIPIPGSPRYAFASDLYADASTQLHDADAKGTYDDLSPSALAGCVDVNGLRIKGQYKDVVLTSNGKDTGSNGTTTTTVPCVEIEISQIARNFISKLLREQKWERLGYGGAGGLPLRDVRKSVQQFSRKESDNQVDYTNPSLEADKRDTSLVVDIDQVKKTDGGVEDSVENGVLDHPFFSNLNHSSMFTRRGPIVLSTTASDDSSYFRHAEDYNAGAMPEMWID